MITPEAVNFMAMHGRGLICIAMTGERLDELELAQMSSENTALGGTAFTVSVDVKGPDVTTGISASDRAQTILAVTEASSRPDDFARPGHVFPLRAATGGVLERRGQTEAAVDMASLAGLYPACVICEIVNDDGTMARVPDLIRFCKKHKLVMITVSELARYRMDLDDGAVLEALEEFSERVRSAEAKEAFTAFIEKRKPNFETISEPKLAARLNKFSEMSRLRCLRKK